MSTPDANLDRLHRIAAAVTWAQIGARDGKPGKVAKRDAKRQAREMRRAAWRGYVPQDDPSREAVLRAVAGFWRWLTGDPPGPAAREHTRFCYQPRGECYFLTCTCWCHPRNRSDVTAETWCPAHHCFRTECSYRTHVHTVRCKDPLWEKVAAKAAAKGIDTNAGVTAALEAWAAGE